MQHWNDEIAQRIAERLYPEKTLEVRVADLERAGKELLDAIGPGVSEHTTLGAAMCAMEDILGGK